MSERAGEVAGIMAVISVMVILGGAAIAGVMVPREDLHRVLRDDDDGGEA